jgi:transposase
MDDAVSARAKKIFEYIAPTYHITLVEWNYDLDHVHILFKAHPNSRLSSLTPTKAPTPDSLRLTIRTERYALDYSSKELYIDHNGTFADYPQYLRQIEVRLKAAQRRLSRRTKGGTNWQKQKFRVARLHEKVANQRKDFLHKESRKLADQWDAIAVEDLNMKAMSRTLSLGKATMDNGNGMFRSFLRYKLAERGKALVQIDRWRISNNVVHKQKARMFLREVMRAFCNVV